MLNHTFPINRTNRVLTLNRRPVNFCNECSLVKCTAVYILDPINLHLLNKYYLLMLVKNLNKEKSLFITISTRFLYSYSLPLERKFICGANVIFIQHFMYVFMCLSHDDDHATFRTEQYFYCWASNIYLFVCVAFFRTCFFFNTSQ